MTIAIKQITAVTIREAIEWSGGRGPLLSQERILVDAAHIAEVLIRGPLNDIHEALQNEGPAPEYHRRAIARYQAQWPTLWNPLMALDAILQDVGRAVPQDVRR